MKLKKDFVVGDATVSVAAESLDGDRWRVLIGDRVHEFTATALGDGGVRLVPQGSDRALVAFGVPVGKQFMVRVAGRTHTLAAPSGRGGGRGAGADGSVIAPMTGTVLDVLCKVGDRVAEDQTLVVLSAMKMEHKLIAGVAGTVAKVDVQKSGTVEQGAVLVVVTPDASAAENP